MDSTRPVTLAQWRQVYVDGEQPGPLLERLRVRLLAESPGAAWIHQVAQPVLQASVAALEQRARAFGDRARLLQALPLYGVPFAVKDNIDIAGWPTTAACPAYAYTATTTAHAVARLIEAGAICMGKTNLDQFATGLVGARSPYGRPSSTFDPERVSGGSSSGSAVVVSRGDVPFALGTDTAGSGRIPAGFNNIVGLKPTPGRVSSAGVVPACRTLDCVSILSLTVADAAAVLAVIEGPDPQDAYSNFRPGAATLPTTLRIGVPQPVGFDPTLGYGPLYEQALARCQAMGHTVQALDFEPLLAVARALYGGPWVAERHVVVQALLRDQPDALDPTVRRAIEPATRYSATDLFRAQYALRQARAELEALWQRVDLIMVPTATHHPLHSEIDADPLGANSQLGTYTNFVNLLGWSALALPAGFTAGGLPFGVTFIAPGAADAALARFGEQWESAVGAPWGALHRRDAATSPDAHRIWPASAATLPLAVVGAHLSGLPLNSQLTQRGAVLRERSRTAARYRLYALPDTTPPKPGLVRVAHDGGGASIEVEVWDVPLDQVGSFLALVAPPLAVGSLELEDGRWVHGFLCEPHALGGAREITSYGGWRAYGAAAQSAPPG